MRLTGKVSIITGAGQGIGRATALKFAAEGAKVAVCDINLESVKETMEEVLAEGGEAAAFRIDVTDKESIAKMVEGVMAKWGRIDTLVNNAGIVQDAQFKKMSEDQFDRVIDVNLKGVYNCTKAVVDIMLTQNSGCILNASSIVGIYGNFGHGQDLGARTRTQGHPRQCDLSRFHRNADHCAHARQGHQDDGRKGADGPARETRRDCQHVRVARVRRGLVHQRGGHRSVGRVHDLAFRRNDRLSAAKHLIHSSG